jgi:hypothetical protein
MYLKSYSKIKPYSDFWGALHKSRVICYEVIDFIWKQKYVNEVLVRLSDFLAWPNELG